MFLLFLLTIATIDNSDEYDIIRVGYKSKYLSP